MTRFYDLYTRVNNVFLAERDIVIEENASDRDIIKLLKRKGVINPKCRYASFQIDGEKDFVLYITYCPKWYPICELRCTKTIE